MSEDSRRSGSRGRGTAIAKCVVVATVVLLVGAAGSLVALIVAKADQISVAAMEQPYLAVTILFLGMFVVLCHFVLTVLVWPRFWWGRMSSLRIRRLTLDSPSRPVGEPIGGDRGE